jgi:hypothetical protein
MCRSSLLKGDTLKGATFKDVVLFDMTAGMEPAKVVRQRDRICRNLMKFLVARVLPEMCLIENSLSVLGLGCGDGYECGAFLYLPMDVSYTGVDNCAASIQQGKGLSGNNSQKNQLTGRNHRNKYYEGDARSLDGCPGPKEVDLCLLRHIEVNPETKQSVSDRLKVGASRARFTLVTCYFKYEADIVRELVNELELKIIIDENRTDGITIPCDPEKPNQLLDTHYDRHVFLLQNRP